MSVYLECLGESTLERLRVLHSRYSSAGSTRRVMTMLFGPPAWCLVCARPLEWDREPPDDVDPWFCSGCCPICLTDEELPA